MYDLALVNGDVYFDNSFHKCNIYIKDGLIKRITPLHLKAEEEYDCLDSLVLPGIIDPHVHFQLDLGNISSRDDFQYGSRAAAFGGVTTIIDFNISVNVPSATISPPKVPASGPISIIKSAAFIVSFLIRLKH